MDVQAPVYEELFGTIEKHSKSPFKNAVTAWFSFRKGHSMAIPNALVR